MPRRSRPRREPNRAGTLALVFGLLAIAGAFVPVVGDFIAIPTGVLAVVLGFSGIRRHEAIPSARVTAAVIGASLGAIGLFIVVLMFLGSGP